MSASSSHAKESGHWYDRHGNQVLEVPSADGLRLVSTTLHHARKRQLCRGVTSITKLLDRPAITRYAVKQAILASLTLPKQPDESDDAWLARIVKDSEAARDEAAAEGTRIHAACQSAIQGDAYTDAYRAHVAAVQSILSGLSGGWLIDIKGKDGSQDAMDRQETYLEHAMQLAATREALRHSDRCDVDPKVWRSETPCVHHLGYGTKADLHRGTMARCGILFVSRTHPGAATLKDVAGSDLAQGWAVFRHLLAISQTLDQYRPEWSHD